MPRFAFSLLAAFVAIPLAASARPLQPDDLYKLVSVSDVVFSPNGTTIASVRRHVAVAKDRREGTIVLTDLATGAQRSLTVDRAGVAAPQFAPDGTSLAFLAQDEKHHGQVYVLPLDGGDAKAVTATAQGVQQFAWRPNGATIAYVTQDPDPRKKAIDAHHDEVDLADDDYLTTSYTPASHLWLVDRDGSHAHRLTAGGWSFATAYPPSPPASPLSWSPDGKEILFTRVPNTRDGDAYRSQIERLDVASGKIVPVTGHDRFEGFAQYSPDGAKIAYLYSRDGDPNNENDVFVTDAAGGAGVDVSRKLDRAIYRVQWYPDGKSLLVGSHEGTRTVLYRLALDGSFTRLETGDVNPAWSFWIDAAIAKNGTIAFPGSQIERPTELWVLAPGAAAPRRLSDVNGATASLQLGKMETVTWTNEGYDEDGVLTYPVGYTAGKKYPLVVLPHGGPQAASVAQFNLLDQLLAAHGYLVFEPNYRGSDNGGNAYERAIYMDAGAGPGRDVMAGLAKVEGMGIVDTARIGVSGWSYGGYMTSWLMSHYHVWKTAISGAAVNDFVAMYDLGDANYQIGFSFKGSPYVGGNMRDYVAQSPITYAAQTRCPVLIISDTGDVRVPIAQSYAMYHALADNHIPVRFVGIPVSGHFPGDPVRQADVYTLWVSWMDQHLK
ncbi:MAG TPA: S9 family peptidase [Candidatus Sulfotelmatobacter sp.]|nr:S9 family peptidase [Candidatus Sulfotelmatobacter sp.]